MKTKIATIIAAWLAFSFIPVVGADKGQDVLQKPVVGTDKRPDVPQQETVKPLPNPAQQKPDRPPPGGQAPSPQQGQSKQDQPPQAEKGHEWVPGTAMPPLQQTDKRKAEAMEKRVIERKWGLAAAQHLEAWRGSQRPRDSKDAPDAPLPLGQLFDGSKVFDRSDERFGDGQISRKEGTKFFRLGGSGPSGAPLYGGSGPPEPVSLGRGRVIPHGAARGVENIMGGIPGGVVLEGKASELSWVKHVEYRPELNALTLDDRAIYFSPIPAHSVGVLARAIASDNRIGVSIAPAHRVYGSLPKSSDVARDLMLTDGFLADFVFPGSRARGYRFANGFEPRAAGHGKVTVLFVFGEFQFAVKDEELHLARSSFDANIVPLASQKAADGGYLPDYNAISSPWPANTRDAVFNASHVGDNFNYYRREMIVARALAYGEVAALFRGLKEAGVDLQEFAGRVELSSGFPATTSQSTDLSANWQVYLKDIQRRNQFANWSGPPHDIYAFATDCFEKNEQAAIHGCTQLILRNPENALAYNRRGALYQGKKNYDLAIADYSKSIALKPNYAQAYHNRGDTWDDKNDSARALADLNEAIRLDPTRSTSFALRGNIEFRKGWYDLAIADYSKAMEIGPKSHGWYTSRGLSWEKKGNKQRAIADYQEALAINPSDEDARRYLTRLGVRPPPQLLSHQITVVNRATSAIRYVYLSSCASSNWGPDRLGKTEALRAGARKAFRVADCCQDIRVKFANGAEREQSRVDICRDSIWEVR